MKTSLRFLWLLSFLVALSVFGVFLLIREFINSSPESKPSQATVATQSKPQLTPEVEASHQEWIQFQSDICELFKHEKFGELEARADEFRTQKSTFRDGGWKLFEMYSLIGGPPEGKEATETMWKEHLEKYKRWLAANPTSPTPRVGLALAYTGYAWKARGSGYGDTVTEEGWQLFGERLREAEKILMEANHLPKKCPHWYRTMQTVALGQNWSRQRYEKLFKEAIGFEPLYISYYVAKAQYLLPRWHGEKGDWEKFALETEKRLGGKQGSIMYYRICWSLTDYYNGTEFFTQSEVSWPKMKQGFSDMEETLGENLGTLNEFTQLACYALDQPTAKQAFQRIGENWDPNTWRNRKRFEQMKAWAMRPPDEKSQK